MPARIAWAFLILLDWVMPGTSNVDKNLSHVFFIGTRHDLRFLD